MKTENTPTATLSQRSIAQALGMSVGSFYLQMASERDPEAALRVVAKHIGPTSGHFPVAQPGTTDDCGFSPFSDDVGTPREIAFAKIAARVKGTKLAEQELG
jgi:5-methyltetrahydropteroyltriglutamate--homocysteine methyltransferase